MILTEKGSTRGTVSVLFISAMVFLGARMIVTAVEANVPQSARQTVAWKPVPDVVKDDNSFEVSEQEKPKPGTVDSASTTDGSKPKTKKKPIKRFALEQIFADNTDEKPILIFFADQGSVVSRKMESTSLAVPEVRHMIESQFYPVKVSFEKPLTKTEYKLYQRYGSSASPILSVRSATGEALAYNPGFLSAQKVAVLLHKALRKKEKLERGEGTDSKLR